MNIREEISLIQQIALRAERMYVQRGKIRPDWQYVASELIIVHREICQLRLKELLEADDLNFAHDILGIHAYIDILDGSFKNGFRPRFAV